MLVEQIINGIIVGSMYALIAQGYTLVFGVLDKLNFAHSEIFMLGGFLAVASVALGASLPVAIVVTIAVSGALGLLVEFIGFRKFKSADAQITASLSSFAIGLVIIDLVQKIWGSDPVPLDLPAGLRLASIEVLGIRFILVKLAILPIALLLMLGLHFVIVRTALGRSIRAVAESPVQAALFGINVTRVTQQVFVIASALAGAAGMALAIRASYASASIGFTFGLKALAIMAIGGMGDLRGALLGGLLIGVVEALFFQWGWGGLANVAVWLFMIAVLLIRPAGLFGSVRARETRA
jgi:branched-chain amino acid transport system permease protein